MIGRSRQPRQRRSDLVVCACALAAILLAGGPKAEAQQFGEWLAVRQPPRRALDTPPLPPATALPMPANEETDEIVAEDALAEPSIGPLTTAVLTSPQAAAYAPNDEYCSYSRAYRSVFLTRLWFRGEYLGWMTKGQRLPPLVTSSAWGTPIDSAGDLDDVDTRILFGHRTIHDQLRSGGRMTVGYWWDPSQQGGIEASYFGVDGHDVHYRERGESDLILARPFYDLNAGAGDSLLISYPGVMDGLIDIQADMEFSGAELLLRRMATISPTSRVDFVAGYRYARLMDQLAIRESLAPLDAASGFLPGTFVERSDLFQSVNEFHGGQLGVIVDWIGERWAIQARGKIGVGATQTANVIAGETATWDPVPETLSTTSGGLLALPSNIGHYRNGGFSTFSEFGLSLEYNVACQLKVSLGYTLIFWTELARAGDQVQLDVNPSQIGGGALIGSPRPRFPAARTDFWAQGLNFGVEYLF